MAHGCTVSQAAPMRADSCGYLGRTKGLQLLHMCMIKAGAYA